MQYFFIFLLSPFIAFGTITVSKAEEKSLREFVHATTWGAEVGYVLFGEKPVCSMGFSLGCYSGIFHVGHRFSVSTCEGCRLWEKLRLPTESSKFLYSVQDLGTGNYLLLFINKEAFHRTFNQHSILFRYALGPEITGEKLLQEFKKTNFLDALKGDPVLIGILLGYGLENSLCVGHYEKLQESVCSEELEAIEKKTSLASIVLDRYSPKLIFGKSDDKVENVQLLKKYEDVQLRLIEILDNPKWLEQVLSQFYQEPIQITVVEDSIVQSNKHWPQSVAQYLVNAFNDEFETETDFQDFVEGLKAADIRKDAHYIAPFPVILQKSYASKSKSFLFGFKMWSFYKFNKDFFSLPTVLNELKRGPIVDIDKNLANKIHQFIFNNIEQHERDVGIAYFDHLKTNKEIRCLSESYLYYQPIQPGDGEPIRKGQMVSVKYTLETVNGILLEENTIVLDLKRAIRGFREGLPFMRRGEKGILYIHPEWGLKDYFSPPYFSPFLVAKFDLL